MAKDWEDVREQLIVCRSYVAQLPEGGVDGAAFKLQVEQLDKRASTPTNTCTGTRPMGRSLPASPRPCGVTARRGQLPGAHRAGEGATQRPKRHAAANLGWTQLKGERHRIGGPSAPLSSAASAKLDLVVKQEALPGASQPDQQALRSSFRAARPKRQELCPQPE